jgi:DNA-binding transcriptional ArsR family regulator
VYEFLRQRSIVSRDDLFNRFSYDDESSLRGVLRDLTESGLVFSSGSGRGVVYRLATDDELGSIRRTGDRSSLDAFVWSIVYGQGPASLEELESTCRIPAKELELILSSLVAAGRVERNEVGGEPRYRSREFVLALEDPTGWEGAVLDHFSACVKTIGRKLSIDQQATLRDEVGGSTYHFVLWRSHPMEREVLGELGRFRERMSALRERIDRFNVKHGIPSEHLKVDAYYGQCVVEEDDDLDEANEPEA